jgi:inner membrane protein
MDIVTHAAIGAIIGEAWRGKTLGKKAMAIGALANCIPDSDIVMSFWLRPVDNLLAHRGITHSFFFGAVASLMLGYMLARWLRSAGIPTIQWILFFAAEITVHLLLDVLNNYGIAWFEPFSHQRLAFNTLYVADPFYSIVLVIACIVLLILKDNAMNRRTWVRTALVVSTLYLAYTFYHKSAIDRTARAALNKQGFRYSRLLTTPTPLNNWLWYVVAANDVGYYIGYRSVFDSTDNMTFTFFPQQAFLLDRVRQEQDVHTLIRFSDNYFTVDRNNTTLLFNDLRFGQMAGWSDPRAGFVFHYDLSHPAANAYVVQQGRFSQWNKKTAGDFVKRIAGIQKTGQ